MNNILLALPEIALAGGGLILLLIAAFRGDKAASLVTWLGLAAFALTALLIGCGGGADGTAMNGMFASDPFRRFAKLTILLASAFTLGLAPTYWRRGDGAKPEFAVLTLFAALGMLLMVGANDLIALYVGLELQNLPLYVLAAFCRGDAKSSEAGLKYFALGALSSAVLLFGLSLVYGFTGTTGFAGLMAAVTHEAALATGLAVGIAFVVAGFAFKISAAPFHMWTPDVYEGAPYPVTAFLAAAPKVAALSLLAVVLAQPFAQAANVWKPIVIALAVVSMLWGALGGLVQTSIKRLMAYSAILNVGTMLVGLVAFDVAAPAQGVGGFQGLLLYLVFYGVGTIGVFACLHAVCRHERNVEEIAQLSGLSKERPLAAFALAASLFSLAGVPPLAGFFGKYFVLIAAVQAGLPWLAVIGVLSSVIAAAYYLRIVKIIYFDAPRGLPFDLVAEKTPRIIAGLAALTLLLFVILPTPLIEAARRASESLLLP